MAVCRALGYDARLVWSLQPIPLNVTRAKKLQSPQETVPDKKGEVVEDDAAQPKKKRRVSKVPPKIEDPPSLWWMEVLIDNVWITFDPLRNLVDCTQQMEPPAKSVTPLHYVVAFYAN